MTAHEFNDEAMLTAYVLGELDDRDAKALEIRLEKDDALRREVDAIRRTAEMLTADLASEPAPGMTPAQRDRVLRGETTPQRPVIFTFPRIAWGGAGLAAAACLALAVWLPGQVATSPTPNELAIATKSEDDRAKTDGGWSKQSTIGAVAGDRAAGLEAGGAILEGQAPPRDARGAPVAGAGAAAGAATGGGRGGKVFGGGRNLAGVAREGDRREREEALLDRIDHARRAPTTEALRTAPAMTSPTAPPPPPGPRPRPDSAPIGPPVRQAPAMVGEDLDDQVRLRMAEPTSTPIPGAERPAPAFNREAYGHLVDNRFHRPRETPLSTFSIDVDTASYANVRRLLNQGQLPPKDAVRLEEMINYFDYAYETPTGDDPFSVAVDVAGCPWASTNRLVRIGLKGREIPRDMRPATSLVFLLDVSGSMNRPNKLPLLKQAMATLVENLTADDRVAIVVYAGASGLVLPSTYCDEREAILGALGNLRAGGSTNGGAGIELAYKVAQESFIEGGVNRVILCTDGDFNVGASSAGDLVRLVEEKRRSGVFLSVLGFGSGNFQDDRMEQLSNKGNGNFAYIDSLDEAKKVLVEEMAGTLVTIAKDVKIQVEFNPATVGAYRLIGYANRILAAEDFNDDTKDAGEIGAGHTVTALYEIVPPGVEIDAPNVDELEYQKPASTGEPTDSEALLTVKLRYKQPDGDTSTRLSRRVTDDGATLADASDDFRFAAAVAGFGMTLRDSPYRGNATYASVLDLATGGIGDDPKGRRAEFVQLVERAKTLAGE